MKDMKTDSKILAGLFLIMTVWNLVLAALGHEVMLHAVLALTQFGWAFQIYVTDSWRARALKAEARR